MTNKLVVANAGAKKTQRKCSQNFSDGLILGNSGESQTLERRCIVIICQQRRSVGLLERRWVFYLCN